MDHPIFEFKRVSFTWPGGRVILENQDFAVPGGTFVIVGGPSGSGKSTLLKMMNRLESPQSGEIRYRGIGLEAWDPPQLRGQVIYLQQAPVPHALSVRDSLLFPFSFKINREKTAPCDGEITALLAKLNLGDIKLRDACSILSGGQRQRMDFLRALLLSPDVLLLDEPTASLDRESRGIVETMAVEYCQKGNTVIMITHDDFFPEQVPAMGLNIADGRVKIYR